MHCNFVLCHPILNAALLEQATAVLGAQPSGAPQCPIITQSVVVENHLSLDQDGNEVGIRVHTQQMWGFPKATVLCMLPPSV